MSNDNDDENNNNDDDNNNNNDNNNKNKVMWNIIIVSIHYDLVDHKMSTKNNCKLYTKKPQSLKNK